MQSNWNILHMMLLNYSNNLDKYKAWDLTLYSESLSRCKNSQEALSNCKYSVSKKKMHSITKMHQPQGLLEMVSQVKFN